MGLIKSKNCNENYVAKVIKIDTFRAHSNPEVTRLKCCVVDGYNIICGIDSTPGLYIYFPNGCCINSDFLKFANLFKHTELNADSTQSGMFEDTGRVKTIRLKGELSEGFILPAVILENYLTSITNTDHEISENTEFDSYESNGKIFWINKKYVIKRNEGSGQKGIKPQGRQPKQIDKIIENQFRFHYDTTLIKKCPTIIDPYDIISITEKVHGTSGISAYLLCKQTLNWKQKIAKLLTGEEFNKYDYIYSSRTVIKNKYINPNAKEGYYNCDVWGEADKILRPHLIKGMSLYYEIIGYLPSGGFIQSGFDYGCVPPEKDETYTYGKHFKVYIYRITLTNVSGQVHEFSAKEVQEWCQYSGLNSVVEYYYGKAKDLYSELDPEIHFSENFIQKLSEDKAFHMECNSPSCELKAPHEGLVIKRENMKSEAFKLKCFKFLNKENAELDKGIANIEDQA